VITVPTLVQMLTVIGTALLSTTVLVALAGLLLTRIRPSRPARTVRTMVPAQRQAGRPAPVPVR
jgi:hypothetical protein